MRYLCKEIGCSKRTLQRRFTLYLSSAPTFQIKRNKNCYLIIDGTYFTGDFCLVLYYDSQIKYSQLYRFSDKESYVQIKEDLDNLQQLGITLKSITCDGNKAILKAIRYSCPNLIIQRCLVHIHRESNIWLRKRPINQQYRELKRIVNMLFYIDTHNDKLQWIQLFQTWYQKNKNYIDEKTVNVSTERWWYRHKDLRRAAVMIKQAITNMFHFLDDSNIPKSTNGIESFFGHLKDTLSIHRGLSYKNRKAFIQWYLHFKNKNKNRT